jgi:AcrR family transcriptional regulator
MRSAAAATTPGAGSEPQARERILRSAARLYALHGYQGTSIRAVAEAAGVTKPLVHYHFGSKEQLFAALLRDCIESCRTRFESVTGATAGERLRAVLHAQFERAREAPEVVAFAHQIMSMPGMLPLGFDYKREGRALCDLYVKLIEDGQRSGEFRRVDPEAVVTIACATVGMYVSAVLAGELSTIPPGVESTVYDLLVHGIATPSGGMHAAK